MKIFLTNLPSFYKINLYNKIAEYINILVVFTGRDSDIRNSDFMRGKINFDTIFLRGSEFQKAIQFARIIRERDYSELIIAGWDNLASWVGAFVSPKIKNSVVIESSIFESETSGVKGILKRLFNSRVSKAFCSGKSQADLANSVGFKGKIIITKGVGVFNYRDQPKYQPRDKVENFVYVGRLAEEKNLEWLIKQFERYPELNLIIIGFGLLETRLKSISPKNIVFLGAINNKDLYKYYEDADVFVLPSLSEPWGLVVEEALNNGLPVMVSDRVGCHEEIVNNDNGVVFKLTEDDFDRKLVEMTDVANHNRMRKNISNMKFDIIEERQVQCYL